MAEPCNCGCSANSRWGMVAPQCCWSANALSTFTSRGKASEQGALHSMAPVMAAIGSSPRGATGRARTLRWTMARPTPDSRDEHRQETARRLCCRSKVPALVRGGQGHALRTGAAVACDPALAPRTNQAPPGSSAGASCTVARNPRCRAGRGLATSSTVQRRVFPVETRTDKIPTPIARTRAAPSPGSTAPGLRFLLHALRPGKGARIAAPPAPGHAPSFTYSKLRPPRRAAGAVMKAEERASALPRRLTARTFRGGSSS
jgi:hypothetical protein